MQSERRIGYGLAMLSRWTQFRRVVLLGAIVLLSGCRIVGDVTVDIDPDGSGSVAAKVGLDIEAIQRIGGLDKIRLDDLKGKGWEISALPKKADGDGIWWIRASRGFDSAAQLPVVLAQLGGEPLLFDDANVSVTDGFASTSYAATVKVASTGSIAQFSDAALIKALDGNPLGRTAAEMKAQGGTDPKLATLTVTVRVPDGKATTKQIALNSGKSSSTKITATSSVTDTTARQFIYIGAGLIAAAAVLTVIAGDSLRRLRRLKRTN